MVRCLVNELHTSAVEEAVVADEEGIGRFAGKRGKRRVDFPAVAAAEELDLQSHGADSRWRVPFYGFGVRNTGRIDEDSDTRGPGYQLVQQFQLLRNQCGIEKIDAGQVAARPGQTRDKTEPDRVFGNDEEDRDRRGCRLRSKDGGNIPTNASWRPAGEPDRLITRALDPCCFLPSGRRSLRCRLPHSRFLRDRDDIRAAGPPSRRGLSCQETRSPASLAAARAPQAATP